MVIMQGKYFNGFGFLVIAYLLISLASCNTKSELQQNLEKRFHAADSVIIASTKDSVLPSAIPNPPTSTIVSLVDKDGKLNPHIITQAYKLDKTEIDTLALILSHQEKVNDYQGAMCFFPHQAIIVYRQDKTYVIELCFECGRYRTRLKELQERILSNAESWRMLKDFFKQKAIDQNME